MNNWQLKPQLFKALHWRWWLLVYFCHRMGCQINNDIDYHFNKWLDNLFNTESNGHCGMDQWCREVSNELILVRSSHAKGFEIFKRLFFATMLNAVQNEYFISPATNRPWPTYWSLYSFHLVRRWILSSRDAICSVDLMYRSKSQPQLYQWWCVPLWLLIDVM